MATQPDNGAAAGSQPGKLARLVQKTIAWTTAAWDYCSGGVWQDTRNLLWVKIVKVANLTVRGFLDGDLQSRACAMTYRTILAIVPGLAMIFAIGRGFGLQDYITKELYAYFPSQQRLLQTAIGFVDSYLNQASEGLFVGVGIVFLLWTLVSLLASVEDVFNFIFNVKTNRSWWRKLSDYTAILLILPVLMICASGIQIFMTTALHRLFDFAFMTPVVNTLIDCAGYVFSWLFFAGSFLLIPNTKVRPLNAFLAGVLAGSAFQALQWVFMTGQMYVTKYNAIYGSFSFLPLMLIWLQLVWLITFICAGICYSSQSIFRYSFESQVKNISITYRMKVEVAILTIILRRFVESATPVTSNELVTSYSLPPRMVEQAMAHLVSAGLVNYAVRSGDEAERLGDEADMQVQPSESPDKYTFTAVIERLAGQGEAGFIPDFSVRFKAVDNVFAQLASDVTDLHTLRTLPLSTLAV